MKRLVLSLIATLATLTIGAQNTEYFEPYKNIDLRLPSVPIIVNDPYFSIWSPFDRLNDGATTHWNGDRKTLDGLLRVDGTTYRFMGKELPYVLQSIMPMADEGAWTAKTSRTYPGDGWAEPDFDDTSWGSEQGAIGSADEYPNVNTNWDATNSDVYARRTVNLTADDIADDLYLVYSHDDVFYLYINGTEVVNTGETWLQGETLHLTDAHKALLVEGENVIAAHCHNTTGGALMDYGLYRNTKQESSDIQLAQQTAVDVLATNSYYTFTCGPVALDVVFTAPMLMDDLELLSTPVNYISYQVRSLDGANHDVQFYLATTPELTVDENSQATRTVLNTSDKGYTYLQAGSVSQPILGRSGDLICIDWGYLYLPGINGNVALSSNMTAENEFATTGQVSTTSTEIESTSLNTMPVMTYVHDFGNVGTASSFAMLAYDEVYDIQYMRTNYKGYWARNGKTIHEAMAEMRDNYDDIMQRCRQLDKLIYDDGLAAGNAKYAELLSASYRHCIAAHKLFEDNDGNILFFSKENNSNGCVNTVDLTYPSAPLFLLYNPELLKGMMTSIFDYSLSGRWTKPFAAHDIGTYPLANGQVYGGDMPLEESGNMLTLAAMICKMENSTAYVDKYWDIITTWADYLVENGQDPENQLCTDDFAGHWAHNANLSVKAIMGVAGYALMAELRGDTETATNYMNKAKNMAHTWELMAREGDHYRLAFDRENTWSQKYNMVWDKLWNIHIFPAKAIEREIQYYLTKQLKYGLPLDSRRNYTKSDWIIWTASMSPDTETFLKFSDLLYKYVDETSTRVPISDWYYADSGVWSSFRARSVVGGHWMKVLMDKVGTLQAPEGKWEIVGDRIKTKWAAEVSPDNVLPEYPRPIMERTDWMNLNGLWQYGFNTSSSNNEPTLYDGEILVPFPLESSLSGVMRPISNNNALWYKREFSVPEEWAGKRVILNFGASDYATYVYVNGKNVVTHDGGFTAFSADITDQLSDEGTNVLLVKVIDTTDETKQPVGKQRSDETGNGSIWYTSVSGIWQTVWLEPVNSSYITNVATTPDLDNSRFVVNIDTEGTDNTDAKLTVTLSDGNTVVAEAEGVPGADIVLNVAAPKLWSPQSPHLYDMHVSLSCDGTETDCIDSYAAMRKISMAQDASGVWRMQLNNTDMFQIGVLDQGYWPDGLYTAPTDEALAYDIEVAKSLGYNMIRKHMKVEPARWYYHCDRLGMLVWQDMPAFGNSYETWNGSTWYDGTNGTPQGTVRITYLKEWRDIINQHYSNPCVVVWTPFNEAWGQFLTSSVVTSTRTWDPTRLINAASGGNHHQGVGDMLDLHDYSEQPTVYLYDSTRPTVLGEYGGLVYNIAGHRWDPDYTTNNFISSHRLTSAFLTLNDHIASLAKSDAATDISAAVYTQLTDVETEMNGLMTYDREVIKVIAEHAAESNNELANVLHDPTGIDDLNAPGTEPIETARYNVGGQRVTNSAKGVTIIRYSDGTARKVVVE